jgi:hypothetical protein
LYTILGAQETCVNNFKGRLGCLIGSWLEVSGIRLQVSGYRATSKDGSGGWCGDAFVEGLSGAVALDYVRGRAQQPVRTGGNACRWPGQRRGEGGRHGAAFYRTVDTGCPRPSALPEGGGLRRSPQGPRHRRAGARGSLLLQGGRALAGNPRGGDGPSLIPGRWAIAQLPRSRLRLRASLRYRLVSRAGFWKSDGSLSQRPRSEEHGLSRGAAGGVFGLGSRRPRPTGAGSGARRVAVRSPLGRPGLRE